MTARTKKVAIASTVAVVGIGGASVYAFAGDDGPKASVGVAAVQAAPANDTAQVSEQAAAQGKVPKKVLAAEKAVFTLTNKQRRAHGCKALRLAPTLTIAARRHSDDMSKHHYFSHNSQNGTTPWTRMKRAGYPYSVGAENIAMGYRSAKAVMAGWMKSPGHRANILNCRLKAIGVGVHFGGYGPMWTQDFGFK
jgi:uncharacterized protein YkwD